MKRSRPVDTGTDTDAFPVVQDGRTASTVTATTTSPEDVVDVPVSSSSFVASATAATAAAAAAATAATADQEDRHGQSHSHGHNTTPYDPTTTATLLTPHTLRLLKLIRSGTAEHAAHASQHLTALLQTQASPVQLWDVLGRLQGYLTAVDWRTRQHAANALQGVARHLPVRDQAHFLEYSRTTASLSSASASKDDDDDSNGINTSNNNSNDNNNSNNYYLEVKDLVQTMDVVLEEGRLLLSSSSTSSSSDNNNNAKYGDSDEQQQQHQEEQEEQSLQTLDQSAAAHITDGTFVQRRVQLQRHILAQRLGLAGLGAVVGDRDFLPTEDVITNDDLMIPDQSSSAAAAAAAAAATSANDDTTTNNNDNTTNSNNEVKQRAKRQKHAARIRKRQQQEKDGEDGVEHAEHSVRALLVMNMHEERQKNTGAASHRSPQTLLATELIYRMFDASWYVRHGALLGTLSLLRAWRSNHAVASNHFGVWPQDILSRCLCVLALDRFGDFSGAQLQLTTSVWPDASSSSTSNHHRSVNNTTGGGVVAPVRETAGQLLSVLFTMAPPELQTTTLELLFRLAKYPSEWEVRHGALVALKFVTVILTTTAATAQQQQKSQTQTQTPASETTAEWNRTNIENISRAAIHHLADDSDDVKSVAAQILLEFVRASPAELPSFVWSAPLPLWVALQKVKSVSSCIVDLVTLLSLFLRSDCEQTLRAIVQAETTDDGTETGGDILQALVRLLDSDFTSVHNAALQSIGVVVEPLSRSVEEQEQGDDKAATTPVASFCAVVKRLYDLYFQKTLGGEPSSDDDTATENAEMVLRDETWSSIVSTAPRFLQHTVKDRRLLELDLMCRYFGIHSDRASGDNFGCVTQAAGALARFLCASGNPIAKSPMLELALSSFLHSPWSSQCEAACIMYREVSAHYYRQGIAVLENLRMVLMESLQTPLLCLAVEQNPEISNAIKSASISEKCDRAFLGGVSSIENGTKEGATEASRVIVDAWKESVRGEGQTAGSGERKSATISSMRIDAAASGAVLAGGLPSKITPLVRALMTSLKNEPSASRRNETCEYIVDLLRLIEDDTTSTHSKARTKVLGALCNMIAGDSNSDGPTVGVIGAIKVVQSVVSTMSDEKTLQDLPPLWSVLAPICSFEPTSGGEHVFTRSVNLLRAVCGGLMKAKHLTFHIVDASVPNLVFLACQEGPLDAQELYFATIKELCSVNPVRVLGPALSALTAYLNDRNRDLPRLAACKLLESLLADSAMEICPFVRFLLPHVMSLMTDPLQECSRIANNIFASLVRFAPLVQEGSSLMVGTGELDRHSESVVDHLILGRPLPPCALPRAVAGALKEGGITLRQYQIEGIAWLKFLQTVKLNGILADEMGLGKTLQALVGMAITHHDYLADGDKDEHTSLIVCPSTVVGHWVAEINKFFPGQSIFRSLYFAGSASERKLIWSSTMPHCNIVVTSYSVLRSDIELLASKEWCYCILDEGHLLKNPKTATARASRRIRARHKLVLTGTPVQNHVNELWATFDFLMPNFLGSSTLFAKEYAKPIARSLLPVASAASVNTGIEKLKELHQQVLPFILRREKEQVLQELPPKTITIVRVAMSELQSKIYHEFCTGSEVRKSLAALNAAVQGAQSGDDGKKAELNLDLGTDALKALLFLRLLCTHPFLVSPNQQMSRTENNDYFTLGASGKILALAELLRDAGIYRDELAGADNDSSLLYCNDDMEETDNDLGVLNADVESSPAIEGNYTDVQHGSKCLIFAQFTRSLDVVEEFLLKPHMPSLRYLRLDGRVPARKRTELVDSFNRDPSIKLMLLTTRAGGLGLNLTGADTVIFLENDYNPFADLQAMDRAHRIGQKRSVSVFHLVARDSIEEKIMELQEKKVAMSNTIVNTDNSKMYSMGTDRLLDIFTFRSEQENQTTEDSQRSRHNLDAIVERYSEDYASLTVEEFVRNLVNPRDNETLS